MKRWKLRTARRWDKIGNIVALVGLVGMYLPIYAVMRAILGVQALPGEWAIVARVFIASVGLMYVGASIKTLCVLKRM